MIVIPVSLKEKLFSLDNHLHTLGKHLYGSKLYKAYQEGARFNHFTLELHTDGSFTLNFQQGLLGFIETKHFNTQAEDVLHELDMLIALLENKLKMVNAV